MIIKEIEKQFVDTDELFSNEKPLVTIITIVLNGEKFLEHAIKSVIEQSYHNIEYIIIDGGSTDGTPAIIDRFKNKISKVSSEPDSGISDAFNKGIILSSGGIIGILNSDDWFEPLAIEKVVEIYSTKNPDLICGAVRFWKNEKEVVISYPDLNNLDRETSVHHSAVFIKRSIYNQHGFYDNKFKYAMDYELLLRMKMYGAKFYLLNEVISNRRLDGISYINRKHALKEVKEIRKKYFTRLNVSINYFYVLIKDLVGRFLKTSSLKILYKSYWHWKNKKLSGDSSQ